METLTVDVDDRLAVVTITRPEVRNARFVDAAEAHAIGLITTVVRPRGCVRNCAASTTGVYTVPTAGRVR